MFFRTVILCVGGLVLGLIPLLGYAPPSNDHGVLKRVTMEMVVNELQNRDLKVAFIEVPVDPSRGITMEQESKIIAAIPEAERTWREDILLKDFDSKRFPATAVVGYSGESYDITLPDKFPTPASVNAMLEKVVALDHAYELVWSKGFHVICPRSAAVRDVRVNIQLMDVPAFDAVGKLGEVLVKSDINLMMSSIGPTPPKLIYGTNRVTMNFVNVRLIDAFCQFAEALGPNYTWSMLEIKGYGRNCGFGRVAD